jgi:NDP-sugar pyrophosphorylase family protein
LERAIDWLASEGITDLAVNLHTFANQVVTRVGDGAEWGLSIRYSRERTLLGTGGALRPLVPWIDGDRFLVLYADNILELHLAQMASRHVDAGAAATLALFPRQDVSASGVAELDASGKITAFWEKSAPSTTSSQWVNAGLLICESAMLNFVPSGVSDLGRDVLPAAIAAGESVAGYQMGPGEHLDWIDTPADLARAEARLLSRENVG